MGVRKRSGNKKRHELDIKRIHEADKQFSRQKAEKLLSNGADPTEDRFVNHVNYHVRRKSLLLSGTATIETATEVAKTSKRN